MTAADLVGVDHVTVTDDQSDKTREAASVAVSDVRKFTSAVSRAKSDADIANIIQAYSQTLFSDVSGTSNPAKTSAVNGAGSDVAESCQSLPEPGATALDSSGSSVGNTMLAVGTKSYSWSSSLPNGSRLEMLASSNAADEHPERSSTPSTADAGSVCDNNANTDDVVANTLVDGVSASQCERAEPTSVLAASRGDVASSMISRNAARTSGDGTVGGGDAAGVAASTKRTSVSAKLRVGDFIRPSNDVSETTFSSPRISLDRRLHKPRYLNECTQDQSQFDTSATITSFSQPRASASRNLLQSPAVPSGRDSSASVSSTLVRNPPSSNSQVGQMASSCWSLPDDSRSFAAASALRLTGSCCFDLTVSTPSIVDSISCLSSGLLEDTTACLLPQLPVTYHNLTGMSNAAGSSYNDDAMMSFAGKIQPRETSSGS